MGLLRKHLRRLGLPLLTGVVWCGSVMAWSQPGGIGDSVRPARDDAAVLGSADAAAADRAAAARRMLMSPAAADRAEVERVLGDGDEESGETRSILLREIAVMPTPAAWVVPAIAKALGGQDVAASDRVEAIAALSAVRTREAVRLLLDEAGSVGVRPAEVTDAAFAGLVRLTGRSEFGADINRWRTWYGQVQWLAEAEWRRELAESLGGRADRLAQQREQLALRLVDALRQQYLAVESPTDRSERLVEFLEDPQPEVRRLGLTLAQQELANARQLDPAVGVASVKLLTDVSLATRRQAAEVVNIMVPIDQADRVAEAIRRETDAEIAALLLKTIARWPMRDLTPILVSWLEAGQPSAAPACDALDAADRKGWLADTTMRDRTLAALRSWRNREVEGVPPSGLRLLYELGTAEDRSAVLALLNAPDASQRWGAATAAAQIREALDALLQSAHSDASLFPLAAQAVTTFRRSAAGFLALADLPAADPIQRRDRLLGLAQELDHAELFQAARAVRDAALREAMLTRLLREPLSVQRESGSPRTLKPSVIAGILLLSKARIELRQPAGALAALDALAAAGNVVDPTVVNEQRVQLLVWLDRLDEAAKVDASPESWLNGLERCEGLEHAAEVAAAIEARFGGQLAPEQASRLQELKSRLPAALGPDE